MNKKQTIEKILSINNDYDRKWLETLDQASLNSILIDNMIIEQGYGNKTYLSR